MQALAITAVAVGIVTALMIRRPLVDAPPQSLIVVNFRGRRIPACGGAVLFLSLLAVAAVLAAARTVFGTSLDPAMATTEPYLPQFGLILASAGFFALGLYDDVSGTGHARGIRGHVLALKRGQVTTGLVKAAGGLALSFSVAVLWQARFLPAVADALTIAVFANLVNLLDLRPGRACKFYLLAWIPMAVTSAETAPFYLPISAGLAAAVVGWLPADLGERGTLGDSGANLLGAVTGVGIALLAGPAVQAALLGGALLLTLASERFSFSRAIARLGPLRWIDGLGRDPE